MPQYKGIEIGTILRKTVNGTERTVEVTANGFRYEGRMYSSLTAAATAANDGRGASGYSFFGVNANRPQRQVTDNATQPTASPKGKCLRTGCYEPADCKHGFCHTHCGHTHRINGYSERKHPSCAACHVGVELEVEYRNQTEYARGVALDTAHRDGSLGSYGAEYKLLAKSGAIAATASELVSDIWKRGARVSTRCGLHVHLDVRQINRTRCDEMLSWMQRTQETWFNLMPASRRNNRYCKRMEGINGGHYTWANRTSYSTVEIRLHGSTLNPFKIEGWLTALVHLQAKTNDANYIFPATGDNDADFWAVFADCPTAGLEYLQARRDNNGSLRDTAFRTIEE